MEGYTKTSASLYRNVYWWLTYIIYYFWFFLNFSQNDYETFQFKLREISKLKTMLFYAKQNLELSLCQIKKLQKCVTFSAASDITRRELYILGSKIVSKLNASSQWKCDPIESYFGMSLSSWWMWKRDSKRLETSSYISLILMACVVQCSLMKLGYKLSSSLDHIFMNIIFETLDSICLGFI